MTKTLISVVLSLAVLFGAETQAVTSYSISPKECISTQIKQIVDLAPGCYSVTVSAQNNVGQGPDSTSVMVTVTDPRESHVPCVEQCYFTNHVHIGSPTCPIFI